MDQLVDTALLENKSHAIDAAVYSPVLNKIPPDSGKYANKRWAAVTLNRQIDMCTHSSVEEIVAIAVTNAVNMDLE